jgi:prefoldin subunit 5
VLKLTNNNELPYLQDKVEYLRTQINHLELEKSKCTNDVLILTRRLDELREAVDVYEASLQEKRDQMRYLNRELKMVNNVITNNSGNKNEEEIEIFYASGSWHKLTL